MQGGRRGVSYHTFEGAVECGGRGGGRRWLDEVEWHAGAGNGGEETRSDSRSGVE
jgi:hypothetical protein